jgi:hypothetical protein
MELIFEWNRVKEKVNSVLRAIILTYPKGRKKKPVA